MGAVALLGTEDHRGTARELPDEILRARVAAGDLAALGVLYDRYGRLTYGLAHRLLGDQACAEDVVQDVFLTLWQDARSLAHGGPGVRAWLVRNTRQRCLDLLRGPSGSNELGAWVEEILAKADLLDVLAHLSTETKQVFNLAYLGGLTHSQIAARMRLPVDTVDTNLRLALEWLIARLMTTHD